VRRINAPCGLRYLVLAGAMSAGHCACAGEQIYEPLSIAVRSALHGSVADRASPKLVFTTPREAQAWLSAMSARLAKRIPDAQTRVEFLTTVQYESKRAGLDSQMVLGLIEVESRFRKYAVSRAGARGYMQVMPFWTDLIGEADHDLFKLRTNLRYGCVILRHYLDAEQGDIYRALSRYNGSLNGKDAYAVKVVRNWQTRWLFKAERPAAPSSGRSSGRADRRRSPREA
jgi:soluble lytic murein transglycosylase-like protein